MRIGAGIALIVAGAIIAFAVRDTSDTLNLTALGIIIMLGGGAGIWLSYRLGAGAAKRLSSTLRWRSSTAPSRRSGSPTSPSTSLPPICAGTTKACGRL